MRLAFQLIFLVNIYAAAPVANNNSSDGLTRTQERSSETVFVYPTEHNDQCHHWEFFDRECAARGHLGLATRNEVLKFRLDQESPIDPSVSWTPVQGRDNWMQIGTQSEYIYGSFNRKCDDGYCETHRFAVSVVTKKEVYCRGGTENSNHNFSLQEILLLCQTNNPEPELLIILGFFILIGILSVCVEFWLKLLPKLLPNPKTTPQTQVSCLPFTSGFSTLPINVDINDFVDFTIPLSLNISGTSTVQTVWFGLTRNKMTVAEGKSLCEKYPGLNVATFPPDSPGFDRVLAMFRKYGKQGEFCLKIESESQSSRLAMLTYDGKWNKGKVSENAEGFIICEVSK